METVTYRGVGVTILPWTHPSGRQYWRFRVNGSAVTRATLEEARKAARDHAVAIYRGKPDLAKLTPEQLAAVSRMLEADPSCRLIDEFLAWRDKRHPRKMLGEAVDEFLEAKRAAAGTSPHNVRTLRRYLSTLPRDAILCDMVPDDLPKIEGAPRTVINTTNGWRTFFRWAQARGWFPIGQKLPCDLVERPVLRRGTPETYDPSELILMLRNVRDRYLPWLALAAFAGIRAEEVCPDQHSSKPAMTWEDIVWERDIIIVRAETAKTGHRRIVPIVPALRSWLEPVRGTGPIGPYIPPSCPPKGGVPAETTRLGKFIGGWKRNALRHSWLSYRAALCGISQAAMEAGNSETEARRSYNDAKSREEAEEWFSLTREKVMSVTSPE